MTTDQRSTATANANGGGTITKQGRTPRTTPFDMSGVVRTDDGILRYSTLAPSLLDMFRASVDRHPDRECIVVLGGERVTYRQVWDRSARVAGGLRAMGVQPGDRVANRHGNGLEWCLGFWGTLMAGAVVVPVNTRFSESEVSTTSSPTRVPRWYCSPTRRSPMASRTSPPMRITTRSRGSSTPAARPAFPRVR